MPRFNLENNIRERFENRELKPSPDAWKKLESQLDKNGPKRKSRSWYYVAASIAGLLIAVSVFLNQNTSEINNSVVIENNQRKNDIQKEIESISEPKQVIEEEKILEEKRTEIEPKQSRDLKPVPNQKQSAIDKKIKNLEALATSSKEEHVIDSEKVVQLATKKEDEIVNTKVNEVVASIQSLQSGNEEVTAEEIETLLNTAQREIQAQKTLRTSRVDATALLEEVEWELEKSFRDKVFDALGEKYQKIRTAISQRSE